MLNREEQRKIIRPLEIAEETVKKTVSSRKATLLAILIGLGFATSLMTLCALRVNEFYDTWDIKKRDMLIIKVKVQTPLYLEKRAKEIVVTPTPTKTPPKQAPSARKRYFTPINGHVDLTKLEMIEKSKYPNVIAHIWQKESSQGTTTNPRAQAIYCKSIGMTNELGFYPQGNWCWNTFEEGVRRLERWMETEAKGLDRATALCYYNLGQKVSSCEYLKDSLYL